jgi:hypothetical protein
LYSGIAVASTLIAQHLKRLYIRQLSKVQKDGDDWQQLLDEVPEMILITDLTQV